MFNFNSIQNFDNHIETSISNYSSLHALIVNMSSFFVKHGSLAIDIGCTTGRLILKIQETYDIDVIGMDIESTNFMDSDSLIVQDIRAPDLILERSDIVYSVFTLQFIELSERQYVLSKIYRSMNKGAALFVCEKELSVDAFSQNVFEFSNYDNKISNNYSAKDILSKEKQLRGHMICNTSEENKSLFMAAGFKKIYTFFQSLSFKGYLLIK